MQVCTICRHPERLAIEAALVRHTPFRRIGQTFNVGYTAVMRHQKHIIKRLAKTREAIEMAESSTLIAKVDQVLRDAQRITHKAEKDGDLQTALQGLRTITNSLALLGRITGEIQAQNTSVSFHAHQHLHTGTTSSMNEAELELEIARNVAEATSNFSEAEIRRLKLLVETQPLLNGALGCDSKLPTADV